MVDKAKKKTLFINKEDQVNTKLFNKVRLARGFSRYQLAVELELSSQTIRRVFTVGSDPRPGTVKKIGEYLGIHSDDWYVPREKTPDETP